MTLLTEKHPMRDFLIPDIFDSIGASFKSDMATMEHPIFVLSRKKDMNNIEYRKDGISISIKPTTDGLPTIGDKDVLLYCGSLLMAEINAGRTPPKTLRVSCHDLLVSTNRQTNNIGYDLLKKALSRLSGVRIQTNIKTNKREITRDFGLIESFEVVESSKVKNRMVKLEITLSDWLYNSIIGKEVLTIHRDYFRLGKPMERRLYEIARKHCGRSKAWPIGLEKLKDKTGSKAELRLFRSRLKKIAKDDHLPDYKIHVDDNDKVTFSQKNPAKAAKPIALDDVPGIKRETILKGERIVRESGTGWCFQNIREQYTEQIMKGNFAPDSADGAFIEFVKTKLGQRP